MGAEIRPQHFSQCIILAVQVLIKQEIIYLTIKMGLGIEKIVTSALRHHLKIDKPALISF